MAALTYQIKKQERFNEELRAAVPEQEVAEDILQALFLALRHSPEKGIPTGRAVPLPIYAWRIQALNGTRPSSSFTASSTQTSCFFLFGQPSRKKHKKRQWLNKLVQNASIRYETSRRNRIR